MEDESPLDDLDERVVLDELELDEDKGEREMGAWMAFRAPADAAAAFESLFF